MTYLQRIKNWLGLFGVDHALTGVSKALKKLEASQAFHDAKADAHALASKLHAEAEVLAVEEAERAARIVANIKKLIA